MIYVTKFKHNLGKLLRLIPVNSLVAMIENMHFYSENLGRLYQEKSDLSVGNLGPDRARTALEQLFTAAVLEKKSPLLIVAGELSKKTFNLEYFEFYRSAMSVAEKNLEIQIILTDKSCLAECNSLVRTLVEWSGVTVSFIDDMELSHFVVVGDSYRYEHQRDTLEADVCFYDPDFAGRLKALFGAILKKSKKITI